MLVAQNRASNDVQSINQHQFLNGNAKTYVVSCVAVHACVCLQFLGLFFVVDGRDDVCFCNKQIIMSQFVTH